MHPEPQKSSCPVAEKEAAGFESPILTGGRIAISAVFLRPLHGSYEWAMLDTFGCAGILGSRSVNLHDLLTLLTGSDRVTKSFQGANHA